MRTTEFAHANVCDYTGMENPKLVAVIFGLVSFVGIYLAARYGRKTKAFKWHEYWLLLAAPLACCISLYAWYGERVLVFFLLSMVIGFLLEYGLGRAYHKTLNRRLWTYSRLSLGGYTSWLTLPMWGIGGVVFWLLGKAVGL